MSLSWYFCTSDNWYFYKKYLQQHICGSFISQQKQIKCILLGKKKWDVSPPSSLYETCFLNCDFIPMHLLTLLAGWRGYVHSSVQMTQLPLVAGPSLEIVDTWFSKGFILFSSLLTASFQKFVSSHIHSMTDNTNAMYHINIIGGTLSSTLCDLKLDIWNFYISHTSYESYHLPFCLSHPWGEHHWSWDTIMHYPRSWWLLLECYLTNW